MLECVYILVWAETTTAEDELLHGAPCMSDEQALRTNQLPTSPRIGLCL